MNYYMNINYCLKVNLFFNFLENEKMVQYLNNKNYIHSNNFLQIANQYNIRNLKESNQHFVLSKENFIQKGVENIDHITCSICMNVVNHPISKCRDCEDLFCGDCIEKYLKTKNNCPKCRQKPFENQNLGPKFRILLNNFIFNCPMECGGTFGLSDIENHKHYCEKLEDIFQCSLCDEKIENHPNMKQIHKKQCEKMKNSCPYCKNVIFVDEFENHLKYCLEWFDYCQDCKLMVSRKFKDGHETLFCSYIKNISHLLKKIENF